MCDAIWNVVRATGLSRDERDELEALVDVYRSTRARNARLERYFRGDVPVVSLGDDFLPEGADRRLADGLACDWAAKAVRSFSNLVRFDGFVFAGDGRDEGLDRALSRCNFRAAFARNRVGVPKKGCAFVTVNNSGTRADVRFHGADSGAAIMDVATERMRSGFVIADRARTAWSPRREVPVQVNLHMAGRRVVIRQVAPSEWRAERVLTPGDRAMMVPIAYAPTDTRPLGTSRITRQIRDYVDEVLRIRLALRLSTALYAAPMRALLGLPDEAYEALSERPKWANYLNPMVLSTTDEDGHVPQLVQLASNSPQALLELIYAQAKLFSGSTGVPLNSLGIVQDNPSSAEAIAEGRKDITDDAEAFIDEQLTPAMREVALLAMAVESNRAVEDLDDHQLSVMPRFLNPARASQAARTDSAMKIASVRPEFAYTDVFFEMVGFDQPTVERVNSQMRQAQARQGLTLLMGQRQAGTEGQLPPAAEGAADEG